jgi:hypothetical protein
MICNGRDKQSQKDLECRHGDDHGAFQGYGYIYSFGGSDSPERTVFVIVKRCFGFGSIFKTLFSPYSVIFKADFGLEGQVLLVVVFLAWMGTIRRARPHEKEPLANPI